MEPIPLYRNNLPQLSGNLFLTGGGIETTLIYEERIELPGFAAFVLLENENGCEILRRYYRSYINIAMDHNVGFILESVTWRASWDWGTTLGYSSKRITDFNRKSIELLLDIRREYDSTLTHLVISGCLGPG